MGGWDRHAINFSQLIIHEPLNRYPCTSCSWQCTSLSSSSPITYQHPYQSCLSLRSQPFFRATAASCRSGSSKRRKEASESQSDLEPGTDTDGSGSGDEGQDDTIGGIDCSTIASCPSSSCDPDLVCAPVHPKTPSGQGTMRVAVCRQGKQSRLLCSSWFGEHEWLTFCSTREKVFCFYCRQADTKKALSLSTKADQAFISKGFNNYKKAKLI